MIVNLLNVTGMAQAVLMHAFQPLNCHPPTTKKRKVQRVQVVVEKKLS